jgi:radical SAM-linked protein
MAQRLRVRYAKRGRLRFASHRDIARAIERAVRRAGLPMAYSAGFSPHPKISYAGAAPTGVASEAEYLELTLTTVCDLEDVRRRLDDGLPDGLDVIKVTDANSGQLTSELEASEWEVALPGVPAEAAAAACSAFLAAGRVEIERLTNKGVRRMDARSPVTVLEHSRRASAQNAAGCAILRMVVRHVIPTVRPDDVLAALRQVSGLVLPSPPMVTRIAQGPLGTVAGGLAESRPAGFPAVADGAADRGAPGSSGANHRPVPVGRAAENDIARPGVAAPQMGGSTRASADDELLRGAAAPPGSELRPGA